VFVEEEESTEELKFSELNLKAYDYCAHGLLEDKDCAHGESEDENC
jgi:hypothetical protein